MAGNNLEPTRKLSQIVDLIASEMQTDACSLYLMRGTQSLELTATMGLNTEAINQVRLHLGEGLVGHVAATAQPLILSNMMTHPKFKHIPGLHEDALISFLGVPILRNQNINGVLTVQTVDKRTYRHEEVETLQTVAMVLAEVLVANAILSPRNSHPRRSFPRNT